MADRTGVVADRAEAAGRRNLVARAIDSPQTMSSITPPSTRSAAPEVAEACGEQT